MLNRIVLIIGVLLSLFIVLDILVLPLKSVIEHLDSYIQKKTKHSTYLVLKTKEKNEYIIPEELDGLFLDSNIVISNRTFLFGWKKSISYKVKNNNFTLATGISLDEHIMIGVIVFWFFCITSFLIFYNKTKPKFQYLYERFIGLGVVFLLLLFISFFIAY